MTGETICWRTLENIVRMAGFARNIRVRTHQRKTCLAVIECGILPIGRIMTGRTDSPKLTIMGVIRGVAGHTLPGCSLIDSIFMARCTLHTCMSPGKRETCPAVVEVHILPIARVVT